MVKQIQKAVDRQIDRLYYWIQKKRTLAVIGLIAVVLLIPSLFNGYLVDDLLFHDRYFKQGETNIFRQYTFNSYLEADRFKTEQINGTIPWWASDNLHVSFFRPLSALTHMADYALWPNNKLLMQMHNILWFALALLAAAVFFRSFYKTAVAAGLAYMFFALDDTHGFPVGWLANRNAIIALFMGLWSLYFLKKYVDAEQPDNKNYLFSIILFVLSLLSGEAGIQTAAFVTAYVFVLGPKNWTTKVKILVPFGILTLGYLFVLGYFHYGAHGSGLYNDPKSSPIEYLSLFPMRVVLLLGGQFWLIPSHISQLLPPLSTIQLVIVLTALAFVGYYFYWMLKNSKTARFWALAGGLCLVPLSATLPMDRNLWFVGLAGASLLAEFIIRMSNHIAMAPLPKDRLGKIGRLVTLGFTAAILFVHTVWASGLLLLTSIYPDRISTAVHRAAYSLQQAPDDKKIVIFNSPSHLLFGYSMRLLWQSGLDKNLQTTLQRDRELHSWTAGFARYRMTRVDESTVRIDADRGFNNYALDKYFRNTANHYRKGQIYKKPSYSVEVLEADTNNLPLSVRIKLHAPVEDFVFYQWIGERFQPTALPEVGQSLVMTTSLASAVRAVMTPVFANWTLAFLRLVEPAESEQEAWLQKSAIN